MVSGCWRNVFWEGIWPASWSVHYHYPAVCLARQNILFFFNNIYFLCVFFLYWSPLFTRECLLFSPLTITMVLSSAPELARTHWSSRLQLLSDALNNTILYIFFWKKKFLFSLAFLYFILKSNYQNFFSVKFNQVYISQNQLHCLSTSEGKFFFTFSPLGMNTEFNLSGNGVLWLGNSPW